MIRNCLLESEPDEAPERKPVEEKMTDWMGSPLDEADDRGDRIGRSRGRRLAWEARAGVR